MLVITLSGGSGLVAFGQGVPNAGDLGVLGGDPPSLRLARRRLTGRGLGSACPLVTLATAGRRLTRGIELVRHVTARYIPLKEGQRK